MAVDLNALVGRIRSAFPDLAFETARLSPTGEDHAVVILDEAWAFRFPRTLEQAGWFQAEVGLLRALAGRTSIATPDYRYLAPDGAFGGYALIHGEEMSLRAFAAMPRADQEAILVQLADFLSSLHTLPAHLLTRTDGVRRTNADWAREAVSQYFERTRAVIAPHAPAGLIDRLDRFHDAYLARVWPCNAVIHGDLREAHLLMAPGGARLVGVIDFGDAVVGDPAYDFGVLWMLGDWALAFAVERYARADDRLLERSRWSFVRYATGRLARALKGR